MKVKDEDEIKDDEVKVKVDIVVENIPVDE